MKYYFILNFIYFYHLKNAKYFGFNSLECCKSKEYQL